MESSTLLMPQIRIAMPKQNGISVLNGHPSSVVIRLTQPSKPSRITTALQKSLRALNKVVILLFRIPIWKYLMPEKNSISAARAGNKTNPMGGKYQDSHGNSISPVRKYARTVTNKRMQHAMVMSWCLFVLKSISVKEKYVSLIPLFAAVEDHCDGVRIPLDAPNIPGARTCSIVPNICTEGVKASALTVS